MTAGISATGQQFVISSIPNIVGVPQAKTAWNQFDELGLLVGLSRLQSESNWKYKRRLSDTFVHRANSSYLGLVYGITGELGLSLSWPISINPRIGLDGNFLASDPAIIFDGVWVYLYSDYGNSLLDYQIDRWQLGGNYEHLTRFVNLVNTTTFFEASLLEEANPYDRTMTILNQSNRVLVSREAVPASDRFSLRHQHIARGSIIFSDPNLFRTEVRSDADVISYGQYYIDYLNGVVVAYAIPFIGTEVRYSYIPYPFYPIASPVILGDINHSNFQVKLFNQVLMDDGTYTNGNPTELGVDIINELYSEGHHLYWGV